MSAGNYIRKGLLQFLQQPYYSLSAAQPDQCLPQCCFVCPQLLIGGGFFLTLIGKALLLFFYTFFAEHNINCIKKGIYDTESAFSEDAILTGKASFLKKFLPQHPHFILHTDHYIFKGNKALLFSKGSLRVKNIISDSSHNL